MLAHEFYGRPSEALWMCGVTGTNGKTSCSQWIAAALGAHGAKTGVIGTLGAGFPGALSPTRSTPRPTRSSCTACSTGRSWRGARARGDGGLVARPGAGARERRALRLRALHQPDARPPRLPRHDGGLRRGEGAAVRHARARAPRCSTSTTRRRASSRGGWRARRAHHRLQPSADAPAATVVAARASRRRIDIESSWGRASVQLQRLGRFNVSKRSACSAACSPTECRSTKRAALLAALPPVPGRMQRVGERAAGGDRLRAHARCAGEGAAGAAPGRRARAAGGWSSCSAPAATAIRPSAR